MKDGFTVTLFRFLKMSEMGALRHPAISGYNSVTTLRTRVYIAFFCIINMKYATFFIVSKGV